MSTFEFHNPIKKFNRIPLGIEYNFKTREQGLVLYIGFIFVELWVYK